MNFSAGPEISACGMVFSARLLEGGSERGAPVGVLIGRNGGRQKIPTAEYSNGDFGLSELTTWRNPNILKLFYGSYTMLNDQLF